jgi:hypothetical protein
LDGLDAADQAVFSSRLVELLSDESLSQDIDDRRRIVQYLLEEIQRIARTLRIVSGERLAFGDVLVNNFGLTPINTTREHATVSNEATLSQALDILGDLLGGEPLAFDDNGLCVLAHQDGFAITLMSTASSDMLLLSAQLIAVPDADREALFAWLLRLNFLGLDTGGAALSIDEEERHVYLCHNVALGRVDAPNLVTVLGNFIEVAAGLRTRLLQDEPSAPTGSGTAIGDGQGSPGWIKG